MRRTNIYLSETEHAALGARATAEGTTRSEVLRSIVDRELNLEGDDPVLDSVLADSAAGIAALARQLSRGDPDLDIV